MISKGMVKFQPKFQFQILNFSFKFYKTAEKVSKIKQILTSFDKYHHLFIFHILLTILFFHG